MADEMEAPAMDAIDCPVHGRMYGYCSECVRLGLILPVVTGSEEKPTKVWEHHLHGVEIEGIGKASCEVCDAPAHWTTSQGDVRCDTHAHEPKPTPSISDYQRGLRDALEAVRKCYSADPWDGYAAVTHDARAVIQALIDGGGK